MNYTKILRALLLWGIALVPFISFIVAGGGTLPSFFFPFISGKNFAFRILVEVLLVAYIILACKDPKYRPRSSVIMWVALAFTLWMALATFFSIDGVKSFWSNFERMDGYVTVLHAFAFFVVAGMMLSAEKWWDTFFRFSVAAGFLQGMYALFQLTGVLAISSQSGSRVDTSFGNAIYVAVFMLFNIFITLYLLIRDRRSPWMQGVYGLALVLEFVALFYSQTRGALLGVVGGLLVMGIYIAIQARQPEWKTVRRWSFGLLAALVVLGGLFFALKDTSLVRNSQTLSRIASISLADRTTQARVILWKDMAIPGAFERPVFGWGQENFSYVFNKYYVPSMYDQEQWFDRTHNEFLDWLVAGGFPAFVLYIVLFFAAAWAIIRSDLSAPEAGAFLGLLAAYGFSNLTVFHDLMSFVYFFLILAFLHGKSWNQLPRWMPMLKPLDDKMISIIAPVVAVVILGGAWMLNAPGITRAQTLITVLSGTNQKTGATLSPEQRIASFKEVLAMGELGKQETMEQLFQFSANTIAPNTSVSPQTKQDIYAYTRSEGEKFLAERAGDARLELFMSVFLSQFGQYDDAIKYLNQALAHSPQKQQLLFQLGSLYIQKGSIANAVETLKKAYDLAPANESARILYAGALYYAGRGAEADALLTEAFKTVLYDNDQLLQVYGNTRQYGRVIGIWQARVAKNPKDANTMLGLASAYFASGDSAKTIETLKKVSELNPSMAGEVQNLITQIQNGTLKPGQQ